MRQLIVYCPSSPRLGACNMKSLSKGVFRLAILLLLATSPKIAWGQSDRGTIRGTIFDPAGAVVPGATVAAINVAKGVKTQTISSDAGNYNIPQLQPGVYHVEAERSGFKKLIRENIRVDVAGVIGLDLQLEVGEMTQSVLVTGAAPQLKSETSEVSTSINPKSYQDLPIIFTDRGGRGTEAFMFLAPGVTGDTFTARINGSQVLSKEMQLDGLSLQVPEIQGDHRVLQLIPPDAIQEFSIATAGYSAEFGNTGGGVSRFTIKSGTNEYHGNLYEFLRNNALNARGFYQPKVLPNRQNEFGGSVGGPITIPGLYDGKNRSFFFLNINKYRLRAGGASLGGGQASLQTMPTEAFRRGDLSELKDNQGNLIQLYDPATTRSDGQGGFIRDPFPGNIIPQNRISNVSKAILGFVPLPDRPGIFNNRLGQGNVLRNTDSYIFKIDHNINNDHKVNGSWSDGKTFDTDSSGLPFPLGGPSPLGFSEKNLRLSHDWVINPTLVNHLSSGFNRHLIFQESAAFGQNWGDKLGLKGVPNGGFPTINYSPFTGLAGSQGKLTIVNNVILLADSLAWVKGRHNLKFGVDSRKSQINFVNINHTGTYSFNPNETAFPSAALRGSTGNAFASFLLGAVDTGSFPINADLGGRLTYLANYVQDDFKLTPTFTLNAGLRWDLYLPLTDVNDRYSIMDPTVPNPRAGGRLGALIFAGEGPGRTGRKRLTNGISWNNFSPRLGFAWEVSKRLVVRSAYGTSFFPSGALGGSAIRGNTTGFGANPTFTSLDLGVTPAFLWDNGFPQNYDRPPFLDPSFQTGGAVAMWTPTAHEPPYMQTWNFGTQFQLAPNWLLDLAYVGTKGTRLSSTAFNANQVDPAFLKLGSLLTLPISDPRVAAAGFLPPYPGFTQSLAQALRPFPQYIGVNVLSSANVGNSTYHSWQAKVEKQFSQGLFLLAAYTWSKTLTDSSSNGTGFFSVSARDHYNRKIEKSLSMFDIPHVLTMTFNYELPIGPGKPFADVKGVAGKILGGWQLNGIFNYQSGEPIGVGVNNTLPLFNSRNLPDAVAGVDPTLPKGNFDPAKDRVLNIDAFRAPAPFTIGNAASILPNARNFNLYNENFGLMKRTQIKEQVNIEFRLEMFNALNRVRFGGIATNVSDPFSFGRLSAQINSPRQIMGGLKVNF